MKFHLGHFLGLSAVVLATSAAFFSVTGLGQLFAGASLAVIIMASALELGKIIIATFLHRYWSEIPKLLKTYLTVGVIVLVAITSAGIYGFLSNAYQQTATHLEAHEGEISLIDSKINLINDKVVNNENMVSSRTTRYDNLMELRAVQEVRLDSMINRRYFSNANLTREEIENANEEMSRLQSEIRDINDNTSILKDSIGKLELEKLELIASSSVAGEIGPLKYMAELTGKSMDVVVNYFILLLIFVFDPLAICLVVATNWVFEKKRVENKVKNIKKENFSISDVVNDNQVVESEEINNKEVEIDNEEPLVEDEKKRPYSAGSRGFSKKIPEPKSVERRIGTNKTLKDGKEVVYKNRR